ncbi:MAG: response regulator [Bryobacterales bacterium]|nr:response regulator [Bryobacterales bacterium]
MKLLRFVDEHELGIASVLLAACLLLCLWIGFDLNQRRAFPTREFVVATDHSPPFQMVNADGSVNGAMVEALDRAAERLQVKLKWRAVESGPDAQLGVDPSIDLWPFVMRLPEREKHFHIAQSFVSAGYILVSAHQIGSASAESLAGKQIAFQDIAHFRTLFEQFYPRSHGVPVEGFDDILGSVCSGEVFAAITDPNHLQDYLLRNRESCAAGPLQITGIPQWRVGLSVGSTKENAALADALRAELGVMAREHALDDLFVRYQPLASLRDADTFRQTEVERSTLTALYSLLILAGLSAFLGARVIRLRRKAARAMRLADDRYRYLADMSHELRTPLNGILGMANLLHDANLSAVHRDYLKVIELSGNELLGMINNVLDLAKLEQQGCAANPEWVSPREVSESLLRIFVPTLQARGIESILVVDPAVPSRALVDVAKFRQIFVNIVGNAVKFTEKGYVHVHISLVEFPSADRHLRVEVADSGPGISQPDQARLFQAFEQASAGHASRIKGTGLGLEISKRLATFAGGRLGFQSVLGQGSTFWFELPCGPGPAVSAPAAPVDLEASVAQVLNGKTIAVVGGTLGLHQALQNDLGACGAEIRSYPDLSSLPGRDAPSFNIILLDFACLEAHGGSVVLDLQALRDASSAELIVLCDGTQAAAAVESWGARWLRTALKPVRAVDLVRVPEGAWNNGAGLASLAKAVSEGSRQGSKPIAPQSDSKNAPLRILVGEDNPVNRMVIKAIIERLGHEGTVIPDGQRLVQELERDAGYDLILMDCNMPGLDGYEATQRIRERFPDRERLPIVAVTANSAADVYEKCIASGMNDVVSKPVTADLLRGVFTRYSPVRQAG